MMLALEERLLLDAAGVGDALRVWEDGGVHGEATTGSATLALLHALVPAVEPSGVDRRREVVFVDAGVADYRVLLENPAMERTVVVLGSNEDGVARIAQTLAGLEKVDAVHLITHGSDGRVRLGNAELSLESLSVYAETVRAWGSGLSGEGDILFYGCDVAAGAEGQTLVRRIAELTGADVAASRDATGAARLGGNWDLEWTEGVVESALSPSVRAQAEYDGLLATYTVTNLNNTGAGSLRQAILNANATSGVTDTIQFSVTGTITLTSMLTVTDDLVIQGDTNGDQVADITVSGGGANLRGLYVNMSASTNTLTVNGVTIDNFDYVASSNTGGGAVLIGKGTLVLDYSTISNSSITPTAGFSTFGGGVYLNANGVLQVIDSTVSGNSATFGGGIRNDGGVVTITRSTFSGNSAPTGAASGTGGGIYQAVGGTLTITDSTISGNSSVGSGGGLIVIAGTVSIDNSTIADNSSALGAGIRVGGGTLTLTNTTVAANTATGAGGGLSIAAGGVVSATNTLIADNTGTTADVSGTITANYSLIENTTGATINTTTSNVTGVDPVLGSLANNGGTTKTLSLGTTSPALDRWTSTQVSSSSTTDQRGTGYTRYFNTLIDIGAYESLSPLAIDDTASATETGSAAGANGSGTLVTNDVTTGTKTVTAIRTGSVAGGGVAGTVGSALSGSYGALTVLADGSFTYVVDDANSMVNALQSGQSVSDSFNYTLSDGSLTDIATLTVTIQGANDTPLGSNDTATAIETGSSAGSNATGNLLTNDSDPESSTLSAVATTLTGTYGTLTISSSGAYVYVVDDANSTVNALQSSQSVSDAFTYTLSDGSLTSTATLTVTIQGANDTPLGSNDTATAIETGSSAGSSATGNLLTNDSDPESATLSAVATTLTGSYGTLTISSSGAYVYVVNDANPTVNALQSGQSLSEAFIYTLSDGSLSTAATLMVTIDGADDLPVASGLTTPEGFIEDGAAFLLAPIVIQDPDSAAVTVTLSLSQGGAGTLSAGQSGGVSATFDGLVWRASGALADVNALLTETFFSPAADWDQDLTITATVTDGVTPMVTGVKRVGVTAVNDAPTAIHLFGQERILEDVSRHDLIDLVITDVDSASVGVTLTLADGAAGVLTTSTSQGVTSTFDGRTWSALGPVADVNALLAAVAFIPSRDWDQDFVIAIAIDDGQAPTLTGFRNVVMTAVNDPPTATNLNAPERFIEDASPFDLTPIVVTDVDSASATVTLTLENPAAGSLSTLLDAGATLSSNGTYWRGSGELAALNALLTGVRFTPAENWDRDFTIATAVSDGQAPEITGVKPVTVIPVHDNLLVSQLSAPESVLENGPGIDLTDMVITGTDSATVIASLTLSDPGAGILSTGVVDGVASTFAGGVWQASGGIDAVNALLAAVRFTPSAGWKRDFTLITTVGDGVTPNVIGAKPISMIAVNTPPTATHLDTAESMVEDDPFLALDSIVITDDSPRVTTTLTLSEGAAGRLLFRTQTGVDLTGDGTAWTLAGSPDQVNAMLAGLTFMPALDHDRDFTLTVVVSDGVADPLVGVKRIQVTPGNDPPRDLTLSSASIVENTDTTQGVLIGVLSAIEVDTGDRVVYSLVDGADSAVFRLGGADSGQLYMVGERLDFESRDRYSVTVRATDLQGAHGEETFAIVVTDQNEAPVSLTLLPEILRENTSSVNGLIAGRLSAVDVDAGDGLVFSVAGGVDAHLFAIGGPNRDQLLLFDGVLDYERRSAYEVTVRVTDLAGAYREARWIVPVINVNEQVEGTTALEWSPPVVVAEGPMAVTGGGSPEGMPAVVVGEPGPLFLDPAPWESGSGSGDRVPEGSERVPTDPGAVIQGYLESPDSLTQAVGDVLDRVAHGEPVQQADLIDLLEQGGADRERMMQVLRDFIQIQKEARTELYAGAVSELAQRDRENPFETGTDSAEGRDDSWFPPLTGERIALLIGVNRYQEPIPALYTPVNDVNVIAALLRARGYQAIVMPDATHDRVVEAFRAVGSKIKPHQDLLIYYAGHGYLQPETGNGYWLLSDASAGSASQWISTRHLSDFLAKVKARHTMVISDSCFSGTLTREFTFTSESAGLTREQIQAKRSVMMMSSGGEEPVMDGGGDGHSVFASRLIEQLKGMGSGQTGFDLFLKVRRSVVERSPQTPQYGAMLSAGHEPGGDYYFQ
ncbi:MAG: DUF4347 domain-containing protein [Magnetococcales bacterium]|nr:DUF4347 domain-containing protein [Magnetococcales bacterium]